MLINEFPDIDEFRNLAEQANVIPVCMEMLADTETPVSLLRKFYKNNTSVFLFESVEGGERWGRYSFLGVSARTHIRIFPQFVEVCENGSRRQIAHNGDPFAVLRILMNRYQPAQVSGLPRFWGGMVGYLTYEMVSFFESIPNLLPENKPLAHFILPDELLIFDNIRHTLLLVVISFLEKAQNPDAAFHRATDRLESLLAEMEQHVPEDDVYPNDVEFVLKAPWEEDDFRSLVKRVKEHIRAGDVIQTVISKPFTCAFPPDPWTLYRAQRFINPSPYLYFLGLEEMTLVGSSPETMVRLENGVATLRPIAGTRPRGKNEQEDRSLANELLSDEKERAEHLMLVDLGRNDLGRVADVGTVQVTDLMIVERYSHVMHLVSNICCDLQAGYDAWDLLQATYPAGTLSGAPKIRAMEIIAELEQSPRGPYGGAVGYISFHGNMDMAITIRTASIENGTLTVQAGAGIVADSNPESERKETVNKAMAMQKALQLVQKNTA
ncbi:MAG: chorismate-binding protein [Deltaproteobacteria bacterium]|jgi:anthranilate synthase component 1|nr:chorismate-binding protein [Deltaproteobacteria bacterium]MBW2155079.1 chorismate-binding protein [Deltaproteobacteria bacterium]MBW2197658.1 chorismate-binding protein [Deltaproteobacteria bacterium]MBW2226505.1 chorismate-binding protein [Deltaproteobacteria bacterium]MDX2497418.1 anthranilate synthase component I family protein [Desulfobacterales bacterium]